MENISWFWMYLISILPDVDALFEGVGIAMAIVAIVGCLVVGANYLEGDQLSKSKFIIMPASIALVCGLLSAATPSYKQLAFIVGGYWVVNNEHVRELPDNVAKVVNGYLEELDESLSKGVVQ